MGLSFRRAPLLAFFLLALPAVAVDRGRPMVGYQLDISRDKVPTMRSLHRIVDILSAQGYNSFQLYVEHTFAYGGHEKVWRDASPVPPESLRLYRFAR